MFGKEVRVIQKKQLEVLPFLPMVLHILLYGPKLLSLWTYVFAVQYPVLDISAFVFAYCDVL